jgi:galactokinase
LENKFYSYFKQESSYDSYTPFQINLIGNFLDSFGGNILSTSIDLGINISSSFREDLTIHIVQKDKEFVFNLDDLYDSSLAKDYSLYFIAFLSLRREYNKIDKGLNLFIDYVVKETTLLDNVSSLEVGIVNLINKMYNLKLVKEEIANISYNIHFSKYGNRPSITNYISLVKEESKELIYINALDVDFINLKCENFKLNLYYLELNIDHDIKSLEDTLISRGNSTVSILKTSTNLTDITIGKLARLSWTILPTLAKILNEEQFKLVRYCIAEHQRSLEALKCIKEENYEKLLSLFKDNIMSTIKDLNIINEELLQIIKFFEEHDVSIKLAHSNYSYHLIALTKDELDFNLVLSKLDTKYKKYLVSNKIELF